VQRQSFGGWKASVVGSGAKAGGPNYVAQLGQWEDAPDVPSRTADPAGWLAWARADDARAWVTEFSQPHDPSGLGVESNVFRYRPVPGITVRVGADAPDVEVQRVLAAAARAGVPTTVVGQRELTDEAFAEAVADGDVTGRIRVVGEAPGLRDAAASRLASVTVLDAPVLASGRRELLTMLREQAVSRTMHRYGHQRTA
jgi:RHH-type proline utilization regulon transcriptional repressor/proline dehydrogenase/delta 1-pyrroline-5-carboxylate dehydrogenase